MTANDCCIGSNCCATTNHRPAKLSLPVDERTGIVDVRENTGRTAKYIIGQIDALKKRNVILDLASIADPHTWPDHNVLADYTVSADRNLTKNMTEMPDACTCADGDAIIDISAFVDKHVSKAAIGLQVGIP